MPYVYSKLACDNLYPVKVDKEQVKKAIKEGKLIPKTPGITIKGGTGVVQSNLETPQGVVTQVTDEELALLQENTSFKKHVKNGFLKVESSKHETEKVVSDMESGRDKGDQLVDEDFEEEEKPVTNKKKTKKSSKASDKKSI